MKKTIPDSQAEQLYQEGRIIFIFSTLVFGFYLLILLPVIEQETLILWSLSFGITLLLRGASLFAYPRYTGHFESRTLIQHHVFISLLFGITQGWLILQFDSTWPLQTQIALWMMVISIVAITIRSHTAVISSWFAFNLPILLCALFVLETAGQEYQTVFLLMACYTVGVSITAMNACTNNRNRIKFELDLISANTRLQTLASRDPLTNLPNRRAFDEFYKTEWERHKRAASPLSVLVIDVDNFKEYNDNYGHSAGDTCLVRIANGINKCLNRPGDKVARLGGEEFTVLLPDTSSSGCVEVAMRILEYIRSLAIRHDYTTDAGILTVSIGGATTDPTDDASPDTLINMADEQLYVAKSGGRNHFACDYRGEIPEESANNHDTGKSVHAPAGHGKENSNYAEN